MQVRDYDRDAGAVFHPGHDFKCRTHCPSNACEPKVRFFDQRAREALPGLLVFSVHPWGAPDELWHHYCAGPCWEAAKRAIKLKRQKAKQAESEAAAAAERERRKCLDAFQIMAEGAPAVYTREQRLRAKEILMQQQGPLNAETQVSPLRTVAFSVQGGRGFSSECLFSLLLSLSPPLALMADLRGFCMEQHVQIKKEAQHLMDLVLPRPTSGGALDWRTTGPGSSEGSPLSLTGMHC